ncbi:hypothetical protein CVIRNUC_002762 [Coccomyxa viridis]|uniref:Uncharacterized protein n=1 Tax=Coccomyxa viridis TaxID=1274662 RepID=A0AAV1HXF5_9CHLO|nr:hypothetical protein CVIRNUC_002762 [Coccomyxa viridis]
MVDSLCDAAGQMCLNGKVAGPQLLDLPLDILRQTAGHLHLKEWARGPSLVCRAMNELSMPYVAIKLNELDCKPDG